MVVLNLLIGVIVNGMEEAQNDTEDEARKQHQAATGTTKPADDLALIERQVEELTAALARLKRRL
jgi:voltage-gated sodium channel